MKRKGLVLMSLIVGIFLMLSFNKSITAYANTSHVGDYYATTQSGNLQIKHGKSGSYKTVVKAKNGYRASSCCISGKYVYYSMKKNSSGSSVVSKYYKINVNGTKNTYLGIVTKEVDIVAVSGNNLYYNYYRDTDRGVEEDVAVFNMKTKKVSVIKKNMVAHKYKSGYLIGMPLSGSFDPMPLYSVKASNKKTKVLSNKVLSYTVEGNYIYFYECSNGWCSNANRTYVIKRCKVDGLSMKKISTFKYNGDTYPGKMTSTYVQFETYENNKMVYYSYTYSSKKLKKISKPSWATVTIEKKIVLSNQEGLEKGLKNGDLVFRANKKNEIQSFSTGNDIVNIARNEVGTSGKPNKYTNWLGSINGSYSYAWCHAFVSWCANQAGADSLVPRTASCYTGVQWFKGQNRWKARSSGYIPQAGDIIYFDWGANGTYDHVGIVTYADSGRVHTIEGNASNAVKVDGGYSNGYSLSSNEIIGYGTPDYNNITQASHFNKCLCTLKVQ